MPTRENHYACHDISVWNSHLPSQNVFLQSVIYSTKKTIILAWGKSRVFSTDPFFLLRRDNNDCRPLRRTWRILCMNKHLTQKTSFPLAASPKPSSAPILKQQFLRQQIQTINIRHFTAKAVGSRYGISRMTCWKHYVHLTAFWQLASKFSQWELPLTGRSG